MKKPSLKHRLHEIIYEADTPAGKAFDIVLLILILLSVVLVCWKVFLPFEWPILICSISLNGASLWFLA